MQHLDCKPDVWRLIMEVVDSKHLRELHLSISDFISRQVPHHWLRYNNLGFFKPDTPINFQSWYIAHNDKAIIKLELTASKFCLKPLGRNYLSSIYVQIVTSKNIIISAMLVSNAFWQVEIYLNWQRWWWVIVWIFSHESYQHSRGNYLGRR